MGYLSLIGVLPALGVSATEAGRASWPWRDPEGE